MDNKVRELLEAYRKGQISLQDAELALKIKPFEELGHTSLDLHRQVRNGVSEVIYGAGKTPEQMADIIRAMKKNGQERILITRLNQEKCNALKDILTADIEIDYHSDGKLGIIGGLPEADGKGIITVVTGGTSDIPVAEEAAVTAEFLGNQVTRLYDVGVAGLHRLLAHMDDIMTSRVIIAIAGMEGALASVVGGLSDCPVLAVPTSVGYGASFHGLSALLSMLNSCASGVSVVNIDNGFGAAYQASMINHL